MQTQDKEEAMDGKQSTGLAVALRRPLKSVRQYFRCASGHDLLWHGLSIRRNRLIIKILFKSIRSSH